MRPVGFSTGLLADGDFHRGVRLLRERSVPVIELSALRAPELARLIGLLDGLDLSAFSYISVHAPSDLEAGREGEAIARLQIVRGRGWPVIVHPDAIGDFRSWTVFGELLCIENMDKRKPTGRTASELAGVFDRLPDASLCFDIGHARQVDPTMNEAAVILRTFGGRLRQLHMSEVGAGSTHNPLTASAIAAFRRVSHLIPDEVPIILEALVSEGEIETEIARAQEALPAQQVRVAENEIW